MKFQGRFAQNHTTDNTDSTDLHGSGNCQPSQTALGDFACGFPTPARMLRATLRIASNQRSFDSLRSLRISAGGSRSAHAPKAPQIAKTRSICELKSKNFPNPRLSAFISGKVLLFNFGNFLIPCYPSKAWVIISSRNCSPANTVMPKANTPIRHFATRHTSP